MHAGSNGPGSGMPCLLFAASAATQPVQIFPLPPHVHTPSLYSLMLGLALQVTSPLELTLLVEKDYFKLLVSSSQQDESAVRASAAVATEEHAHSTNSVLLPCQLPCVAPSALPNEVLLGGSGAITRAGVISGTQFSAERGDGPVMPVSAGAYI